jgi:hypothetical protein
MLTRPCAATAEVARLLVVTSGCATASEGTYEAALLRSCSDEIALRADFAP